MESPEGHFASVSSLSCPLRNSYGDDGTLRHVDTTEEGAQGLGTAADTMGHIIVKRDELLVEQNLASRLFDDGSRALDWVDSCKSITAAISLSDQLATLHRGRKALGTSLAGSGIHEAKAWRAYSSIVIDY